MARLRLAPVSMVLGGLVNSIFLQETEDGFGNYRMAGFLLYGVGGWGGPRSALP